ncbi:Endocytosis and vacuole integrity protein, partial [Coemansia sp. RSA 2607]
MMASSVNLGSYLQTELQALSGEARRKHPEVKEAAERVLVILRGAKSNSSSDGSIASFLQQSDEIVRPFALACQSSPAGGKLASMALQGVQQLVAAGAVSSRSVGEVLDTLRAASAMGVEVQVKALQTVLPLVTLYGEVAGEKLVEALHVCVALQRSRDGVVGNTAAAILRQAVEEVFERVAKDKQGEEDGELAQQHVHDAQFVLQDLCLLAGDGQPVLLQQARGMDRLLVLELLEAILASHASAVMAHAPMVHVLRERLAPHLVGYFADPSSASFALSVRSIRVLTLFIQHMHAKMPAECEVFLGILARLVDGADGQEQEDGCCWRVLALESVRRVGGQGLLQLFERYDAAEGVEDCHVVGDLVASVARVAALYDGPEVVSDTCDVRRALRTLLDKHAAPRVSPAYAVSQALHTVAALADALALSLLPSRTRHVLGALEVVDRPGMQGESHGALLLQHTWPALLPALDRLLGAPLDGYMFSRAVDTAGRLLCTCGALRLVSARDALLAVLCAHADTQDAPGDAQRQTRCLREALQSAQYLAAELGSQWSTVLCAVQRHAQGGEDVPGEVHEVLRVARCAGRDAYLWVLRGLVGLGCATGGVPVPEGIAGVNVAREPADRPLLSTVLLRDLCVATDGSADALLADAEAWRLLTDHLLTLATHPAASDAGRAQAAATLCAVVLAGV